MANEDLYKLLEVNPKARIEVIEAAYRVMSQASHPDKPTNKGDLQQRLNDAMKIMRDDNERAKYDASHRESASASQQTEVGEIVSTYPSRPTAYPEVNWQALKVSFEFHEDIWAKASWDLWSDAIIGRYDFSVHSPGWNGPDANDFDASRVFKENVKHHYLEESRKLAAIWNLYKNYIDNKIVLHDSFWTNEDDHDAGLGYYIPTDKHPYGPLWPDRVDEIDAELDKSIQRSMEALNF
jgi:hypothetical protein